MPTPAFELIERSNRFDMAIRSLDKDVSLHELALLLLQACEEVVERGDDPAADPACAVISARIGFASPADTMSSEKWQVLVKLCETQTDAQLHLSSEAAQ